MFFAAAAFPLLGGARPVVVLRCFSRKHGSVCAPGRPSSGCSSFVFRREPRRYYVYTSMQVFTIRLPTAMLCNAML